MHQTLFSPGEKKAGPPIANLPDWTTEPGKDVSHPPRQKVG